jgi:hypothetical protein
MPGGQLAEDQIPHWAEDRLFQPFPSQISRQYTGIARGHRTRQVLYWPSGICRPSD